MSPEAGTAGPQPPAPQGCRRRGLAPWRTHRRPLHTVCVVTKGASDLRSSSALCGARLVGSHGLWSVPPAVRRLNPLPRRSRFQTLHTGREPGSAAGSLPFPVSSRGPLFGCVLLWGLQERAHFLCIFSAERGLRKSSHELFRRRWPGWGGPVRGGSGSEETCLRRKRDVSRRPAAFWNVGNLCRESRRDTRASHTSHIFQTRCLRETCVCSYS